ncbi:uncharacterized protein VP01_255g2 [Puccinia sorghi]|uniref:Uncharacterized protein n=1 Tax=Puccinia sorghi TaxID=27349 RepID=A0A0L6V545_9BASI|nr:uncharacterized protein VP01_255g2 [Puccinia sorghi]
MTSPSPSLALYLHPYIPISVDLFFFVAIQEKKKNAAFFSFSQSLELSSSYLCSKALENLYTLNFVSRGSVYNLAGHCYQSFIYCDSTVALCSKAFFWPCSISIGANQLTATTKYEFGPFIPLASNQGKFLQLSLVYKQKKKAELAGPAPCVHELGELKKKNGKKPVFPNKRKTGFCPVFDNFDIIFRFQVMMFMFSTGSLSLAAVFCQEELSSLVVGSKIKSLVQVSAELQVQQIQSWLITSGEDYLISNTICGHQICLWSSNVNFHISHFLIVSSFYYYWLNKYRFAIKRNHINLIGQAVDVHFYLQYGSRGNTENHRPTSHHLELTKEEEVNATNRLILSVYDNCATLVIYTDVSYDKAKGGQQQFFHSDCVVCKLNVNQSLVESLLQWEFFYSESTILVIFPSLQNPLFSNNKFEAVGLKLDFDHIHMGLQKLDDCNTAKPGQYLFSQILQLWLRVSKDTHINLLGCPGNKQTRLPGSNTAHQCDQFHILCVAETPPNPKDVFEKTNLQSTIINQLAGGTLCFIISNYIMVDLVIFDTPYFSYLTSLSFLSGFHSVFFEQLHHLSGSIFLLHPWNKCILNSTAVEMQHSSAKLPTKLHLFGYVDYLAQSLSNLHSEFSSNLVESLLEKVWISFLNWDKTKFLSKVLNGAVYEKMNKSKLVYSVSFYLSSVSLSLILFFTRQQSLLVAWLAVLLTIISSSSLCLALYNITQEDGEILFVNNVWDGSVINIDDGCVFGTQSTTTSTCTQSLHHFILPNVAISPHFSDPKQQNQIKLNSLVIAMLCLTGTPVILLDPRNYIPLAKRAEKAERMNIYGLDSVLLRNKRNSQKVPQSRMKGRGLLSGRLISGLEKKVKVSECTGKYLENDIGLVTQSIWVFRESYSREKENYNQQDKEKGILFSFCSFVLLFFNFYINSTVTSKTGEPLIITTITTISDCYKIFLMKTISYRNIVNLQYTYQLLCSQAPIILLFLLCYFENFQSTKRSRNLVYFMNKQDTHYFAVFWRLWSISKAGTSPLIFFSSQVPFSALIKGMKDFFLIIYFNISILIVSGGLLRGG